MIPSFFSQPTREWFARAVGEPTPVQTEGWQAIAEGGDVLVSAPTGTGKTLTAFLYWLDRLSVCPAGDGCVLIYVSPLKALGNDIRENLRRPLEGLGLSQTVRVGVRTGDTPASQRAAMLRRPPHILITTPESLYLLLTSEKSRTMLASARCVILDELHSVLPTKRGAHLMLSLERLDALCGYRLQRIALSATVRPLEAAADFLSGGRGAKIVAPKVEKKLALSVELPGGSFQSLPEHSVWPAVSRRAFELSQLRRTTLAFVDGRQQAEKLAYGVNAVAGGAYARTHHGCVSKEQRLEAERQLRSGELRMLCCTSSMELGIDVGEIDLVLQIGSPASVSGLTQRAGRAGHGPGKTSRLVLFPKTSSDCLGAALSARAVCERRIESTLPPQNCLDVLAQHLLSMAAAGDYTVDEAFAIVRGAWSFRDLTRADLENVLRMLAGDYEHDREIPVRPRLLYDRLHDTVRGDNYTRLLALSNAGTIPDRGWFTVVSEDGARLGELDEEFVFEARLGDRFLLGAFAWRIQEITRDKVIVSPVSPEGARPPFWRGDSMGRPLETARWIGARLRELNAAAEAGDLPSALCAYPVSDGVREEIARCLTKQREAAGCLADDRTVVAEHFADEAGEHQLMLHSVFGVRVNRALSMLLRHAASDLGDLRAYEDDEGVLLYRLGGGELPDGLLERLSPEGAPELIRALLPAEPAFSMAYRYAAARAGMMGMRGQGRTPLWVQRLRGAESLSRAVTQADHPLIREALRECAEELLDVEGAVQILKELQTGRIRVLELHNPRPSPMALPLRRQLEAELLYESPIPSQAAEESRRRVSQLIPERETLETPSRPAPDSPEALHSALMIEGDALPEELDVSAGNLEELAAQGRALYVEPGLWIAAEQAEEYAGHDYRRRVRRLLRYRGAQDARSVAQRYAISESDAQSILLDLEKRGEAVEYEGAYVHPDVYEAARRRTVALRRSRVSTAEPRFFAALMARRAECVGSARAQLEQAVASLAEEEQPAALWEELILPRRVPFYRPELLDRLLSEGVYTWSLRMSDEKSLLRFVPTEDLSLDETVPPQTPLSPRQEQILRVLECGGAQFDSVIAKRVGGSALDDLQTLSELGLVRQDAFHPVRRMLKGANGAPRSVSARWERACRPLKKTFADRLSDRFRACPILCRETCGDLSWSAVLEAMRRMELEGTVRRGYFVRTLSGAQFVRQEDFDSVTAALGSDDADLICLSAADPAQMWGRILRHEPGREFLCVPGTCVVLKGGLPVCVFERHGAALRLFDPDPEALRCFADSFRRRQIYPTRTRVCVKDYPPEAAPLLEQAGFSREALDYTLFAD